MPLTLPAAWTEAVQRENVDLRFWAEIDDGTTQWTLVDGLCDQIDAPIVLESVSPVSVEVNPLTRKVQTGSMDIVVDDAWLRPIMVANRIARAKVTIKTGAQSLAIGNFVNHFTGVIDKINPMDDGKLVGLELLDPFTILKKTGITGYWYNLHPLEVLEDILSNLLPAALYDATSLDPSQSKYTSISHHVVTRGRFQAANADSSIRTPIPAWDVVSELCQLLDGSFVSDESGALTFVLFDSTAAATFNLTDTDLVDFKTLEIHSDVVNRVSVDYYFPNQNDDPWFSYQQNDTDSQSNYAYPGESERILEKEFKTDWVSGAATLKASITDIATNVEFWGHLHAFAGTNQLYPVSSQPAWAAISVSRTMFIKIDDEIIEIRGYSPLAGASSVDHGIRTVSIQDTESSATLNLGPYVMGVRGLVASAGRGALGTTAAAHTAGSRVFDVTIPVYMASSRIDRFGDGLHKVSCQLNAWEHSIQVGDIGTITESTFVAFGKDGLTTADKWEVISKSFDQASSPPLVNLILASADSSAPTKTHKLKGVGIGSAEIATLDSLNQSVMTNSVISGLDVSQTSGLGISTSPGVSANASGAEQLRAASTHTAPASKDTYVYKDTTDGSIIHQSVTLGAAAPQTPPGMVPLAKVVTDATSVTSVDSSVKIKAAMNIANLNTETEQTGNLLANGSFSQWSKG